ncbi:phosphate signaling complex protein PhoU [Sorangium sp. So ce1153]|uniref:phosphate signaling complex protein PhoU n=1 Tax=Sorangium sp. So ce1153 TaxID=3133333 RepID=UPI003F628441
MAESRSAPVRGRAHIYRAFDRELAALKRHLREMGELVEAQIAEATRALVELDPAAAARVIEADRLVNARELAIDDECIKMIALRQPAGSDLRFIAASLKIVTDLERIGDLAVNMAERVEALCSEPPTRAVAALPRMSARAQRMLRDALEALLTQDIAKAEGVLAADADVDRMLVDVFDELRREARRQPGIVDQCVSMMFFAKHVERLADHATNLAEMVVFLVRGEDVRHATRR